jgi:3-phenylpropionate/trans-cinnamate dioxygenase ferredoxin subunit
VTRAVRIAAVGDLGPGSAVMIPREITGTSDDVALVCDEVGHLHALDDTCTHFLASLALGRVADGCVECPAHSARFDLRTGQELSTSFLPAARVHRIELRDGQVYLLVDEG